MKIYILGSYYSDNLGDGVICECAAYLIRKHFPNNEIVIYDLMDRDRFTINKYAAYSNTRKTRTRMILRRYATQLGVKDLQLKLALSRVSANQQQIDDFPARKGDLVVFAGGQMFMDSYALLLEAYIRKCIERDIPVIMNACGTGPSYSKEVQKRLSTVLNDPHVRSISCRDNVTICSQKFTRSRNVIKTCDAALWSGVAYQITDNRHSERININTKENQRHLKIGLGIMFTDSILPEYVLYRWKGILQALSKKGILWQFFVNGGAGDIAFARMLYEQLDHTERTFDEMFLVPNSPVELVKLICGFDGILSFRLHSHIVAASCGVPSVALTWDKKLNFFFHDMGMDERCMSVKERPDSIVERLLSVIEEGVPDTRIQKMRESAEKILVDSVQDCILSNPL